MVGNNVLVYSACSVGGRGLMVEGSQGVNDGQFYKIQVVWGVTVVVLNGRV